MPIVNIKDMLPHAYHHGYAVDAFDRRCISRKKGPEWNGTYLSPKCRESRHSRVSGNPESPQTPLDSRLRGNDRLQGLWEICGG